MRREDFPSLKEAERALLKEGLPRLQAYGAEEKPPVRYTFHEELRGPEVRVNGSLALHITALGESAGGVHFAVGVKLSFPQRDQHRNGSKRYKRSKATGQPDWLALHQRVALYLAAMRDAEARTEASRGTPLEAWREDVLEAARIAKLDAQPGADPGEVVVDMPVGGGIAAEAVVVRMDGERVGVAFDITLPTRALGLYLLWLEDALRKTLLTMSTADHGE